jgi:uncharacterized phage protein gp47/JayE
MATLDSRGLTIDKIPDITAKIRAGLNDSFASVLPVGQSLDTDSSSVIMRLLAPVIELLSKQEEAIQQVYSNLDINTATDNKLEDLCVLGGVYRKPAQPADVMLMLYGEVGTTIASGSFVSSAVTNDVFETLTNVTLDTSSVNGVELSIDELGTNHTITVTWSVNENTNTPIIVNILATDSLSQAQNKLVSAVNSTTDKLTANSTGSLVKIIITNQNDTGFIEATSTTVVNVYKPVNATATVIGKLPQDRLTITNIQSSALGWLGVTNPFDANEGSDVESDEELRTRYKLSKLSDGNSQYDNLYAAISTLEGVRYLNIKDNKFDVTVGGLPSHSFAVVVLGGDDQSIGQAIVNNQPIGILSYGDTSVIGTDLNNNPVSVEFSRPDLVPIKINITLSLEQTFPDNGAALIKQAIIDYFSTLTVGDDILYSRLFTPINSVGGFSVNNMQIARVSGVFGTSNLVMQYNELPTISHVDITFGGV